MSNFIAYVSGDSIVVEDVVDNWKVDAADSSDTTWFEEDGTLMDDQYYFEDLVIESRESDIWASIDLVGEAFFIRRVLSILTHDQLRKLQEGLKA